MSTKSHHRIIALKVQNVKRIKCVEILPTTDVITIGGANDAGKSSLLDSIMYLIAGNAVLPDQPIRQGSTKAEIEAELKQYPGTDKDEVLIGDLRVKKVFTSSGAPTLRITTKDGIPISSPQTILDQLCVKVTFDPLAFTRMEPQKQVDTLRMLVGLDFSEMNKKQKEIYEARTTTNREVVAKRAKMNLLGSAQEAPDVEVSVAELMKQLNAIRDHNKANDTLRAKTPGINGYHIEAKKVVDETQMELLGLRIKLENTEQRLVDEQAVLAVKAKDSEDHQTAVSKLADKSEDDIQAQINTADEVNSKVRANRQRAEAKAELERLEKKSVEQTNDHDAITAEREKQLAEAKFPLPGLGFDDSGVLLHGVPFNQAGTAAKIKASMAIGLALNPRLRVVLIRDGSLLDDESMKVVADMAAEHKAQCWIEVVGDKGKPSVVIEDGSIKEV